MLKLHKGLRAYQKAKIFRVRTGGSPENPIKMFELVPEKPVHHLPGQYIDLKTGIEGCRKLSLSLTSFDPNRLSIAVKNSEHPTVKLLHENVPDASGNLDEFICPLKFDQDSNEDFTRPTEDLRLLPNFPDAGPVQEIDVQVNEDTSFVLEAEILEEKPVVLIAGGIGINAYVSMLDYLCQQKLPLKHDVTLIVLMKHKNTDFFQAELEKFQTILGQNLQVKKFVVTTNSIDKVKPLLKRLDNKSRTYICGPSGMMKSFINVFERLGFEDLVVENWALKAFGIKLAR